jgi:hypothetical protein
MSEERRKSHERGMKEKSHERGKKDMIVTMTKGTYPWSSVTLIFCNC